MKRAIDLMLEDRDAPLSHAQLARAACMSEFHFSRVFHEATGLPPLRFQSALRLAKARDLLVNTDDAVIEICLRVGYSSIGSFTRRFTELVGISPMRLRQHVWENKLPEDAARPGSVLRVRLESDGREVMGPILVAAFEAPLPFGVPLAHTIASSGTTLSLAGLEAGRFYLLAFATNRAGPLRTDPVSLTMDMVAPNTELTLTLRHVEPTDPPILSFIPFMVHWHHRKTGTERL